MESSTTLLRALGLNFTIQLPFKTVDQIRTQLLCAPATTSCQIDQEEVVRQEGEEVSTAAGPEVTLREVVVAAVEGLETVAKGAMEVPAVGEALILKPLLLPKYLGERAC